MILVFLLLNGGAILATIGLIFLIIATILSIKASFREKYINIIINFYYIAGILYIISAFFSFEILTIFLKVLVGLICLYNVYLIKKNKN